MVLKCFWRINLVNGSTAWIRSESGSYNIVIKILATMAINIHIFIWLLQAMILHMRISCITLFQMNKLKQVHFII